MTRHTAHTLRAQLAGLPPLPAGAELILRPNEAGAVATVRADGQAPRVFALDADGTRELRPEHDEDLPGAALLADPVRLAAHLEPRLGPITGSTRPVSGVSATNFSTRVRMVWNVSLGRTSALITRSM